MRALIKLILLLVLLGILAIPAVAWFALSETALVDRQVRLSHQDIARAQAVLRRNDPRNLPAGSQPTIVISRQDLNLAANYLLQTLVRGGAEMRLSDDLLQFRASARIPHLPWRNILNIDGTLLAHDGKPEISELRVGSVPIPGMLATGAAKELLTRIHPGLGPDRDVGPIRQLRVFPDHLQLTYQWHPGLIDQARDTLLSSSDREALRFYHDQLIALQDRGIGTGGSLTGLLQATFAAAQERSVEGDPVEENTALLTVLGTWAGRQNLSRLVPDRPRRPRSFRLKIERRKDFAQHFLTSAALAARGDSSLSDAVGLFKEIRDTDRGSGFSFTDIAADRAGSKFGEFATRSPEHARRVQQRLAAGIAETDIMPLARDLPEHMRSDAFQARFGYVGSPQYQQVMDEIERRIESCALYRQ